MADQTTTETTPATTDTSPQLADSNDNTIMMGNESPNDQKTQESSHAEDTEEQKEVEDVLLVPKRLTKSSYKILVDCNACPKPWHFQGRFGSRTHRVDDDTMGLPIISKATIQEKAEQFPELKELLQTDGVSIVTKAFWPSPRARNPPEVDARIHPERSGNDDPEAIHKRPDATDTTTTETITTKKKPLFTYAELFAGIGGFGIALDALGGECIFCSELEEHCRALYEHNLKPSSGIMYGDIYKIPDSEFPQQQQQQESKSLDLLVGGFPCQPFSNLGTQPGLQDEVKGQLFLQIVRMLNVSKPKAFLLENVPGLLSMTETFETIRTSFETAGYAVKTEVCSARGLTVTGRKRLFFVGHRKDLLPLRKKKDRENENDTIFEFPYVPDLKLRARDVLDYDDMPDAELEILRLAETPTMQQLLSCNRWRPASLAWPNKVCETLISHYGNAVGRGESQLVPSEAPHNVRRFSIRECARLMGFPNTFTFLPQRTNQGDMAYRKEHYRMFGNAVCPPLIAVLAGAVLAHCFDNNDDDDDDDDDGENKNKKEDWVLKGRRVGVQLAWSATREEPVRLPAGCLALSESSIPKESKKAKRKRLHEERLSAIAATKAKKKPARTQEE